jgi:hypothetical protein
MDDLPALGKSCDFGDFAEKLEGPQPLRRGDALINGRCR